MTKHITYPEIERFLKEHYHTDFESKVLCTLYQQIIRHKPTRRFLIKGCDQAAAKNFLSEFKGVSAPDITESIINSLVTILAARHTLRVFMGTRINHGDSTPTKDENSIYSALTKLQPDKITKEDLYILSDFVRWEAKGFFQSEQLPNHYNTFGTGGDGKHTVNISTISAILAAEFLNSKNDIITPPSIVKLGTRAITGRHGSAQVAESLIESGSVDNYRYYSLGKIGKGGFPYSDQLTAARKRVNQEGMMDIYKVIFPGSNLSGADYVVTGHVGDYFEFLQKLADYHRIVASYPIALDSRNDELMPKLNRLHTRTRNGKWTDLVIEVKASPAQLFERNSREEQIQAAKYILAGKADDDSNLIIAYNTALLVFPAIHPDRTINQKNLSELATEIAGYLGQRRIAQSTLALA